LYLRKSKGGNMAATSQELLEGLPILEAFVAGGSHSVIADDRAPKPPSLKVEIEVEEVRLQWAHAQVDDVWRWVVYYKRGGRWQYVVFAGAERECRLPLLRAGEDAEKGGEQQVAQPLREVAVSALDRLGNESAKARFLLTVTGK
jgi:hypothetical protein